ncbi:MAG: NAD(P)-dependent glycerol-3-phosphate dehydrogenase [Persephonella sp.]|nr:MAG: NAD(P)-dependent glycerol-3-phosphate dehydrogenase [Persephonella sp.]
MIQTVGIIGSGSWGTALAQVFSEKCSTVKLWGRNKKLIESINKEKINFKYLPEIILNENIKGTTDLEEIFLTSDIIVIAIPTQVIRETLKDIKLNLKDKIIISASKGIEIDSLKLVSDILNEVLDINEHKSFVLSGPSFAKEVAQKLPTAITLAGNIELGKILQRLLTTTYFRIYTSNDIKGAEIGGAVKNVIAIATGVSDGLGFGNNARASLITRGLYEMTKLAKVYGGKSETLYGLAGLGDLVLTATGNLSRNRKFGYLIGKGLSINKALEEVNQVVEGVKTVKAIKKLIDIYNLELPISEMVYRVVYENLPINEAVKSLMTRELKSENIY